MTSIASLPLADIIKHSLSTQSRKVMADTINNTQPGNTANPLIGGKNTPDFSAQVMFSAQDKILLGRRGLDSAKQEEVQRIYNAARDDVAGGAARVFLLNLNPQALALLQQASSLADPIDVDSLSEEGAENLLLAPHEAVDLDNDGIVEVGAAKTIIFPPVNAPAAVKEAWNATIKGMDERDALALSGHLALPLTLPNSAYGTLTDMTSTNFNWRKYTNDMIYANNMARPYNTPEMSNKVQAWLAHFQAELAFRGMA